MAEMIGQGTTLGYSDYPTPTTYTAIAAVFDISTPSATPSDVKVTSYGTTGSFHAYIPGFSEGGEVTAQINYTKAEQATLYGLLRTNKSWKITLPDSGNWVFAGYIKEISNAIPLEDRVTTSITIKVISAPVFSAS